MRNKQRFWWVVCFLLVLNLLPSRMGISQQLPTIIILRPGNGSSVTAPIQFSAELKPGEDGLVRVTLTGQNGQLLVRQLSRWAPQGDSPAQFTTELAFEIPTESIQGLLTIETQDKYHRPMAARGVSLTLLSSGQSELQPPPTPEPWITITHPQPYENISGGEFVVKGTATPVTAKPIIFELITETGGVIGSKQLAVDSAGEPLSFEVPVSYSFITSTRDVRLVMRQTIDPYGENIVLDSLPLFLTP